MKEKKKKKNMMLFLYLNNLILSLEKKGTSCDSIPTKRFHRKEVAR